jgi:undecaprenyl-diphosphatase
MNAVLAYIDNSDRRVSGRLADWNPPRWFRVWMLSATRLGDGWLWALIALTLVGVGDFGALGAAALACCAANGVMVALKKKFRRSRPCPSLNNAFFQVLRADLKAFDDFSFPSGHTMNAFAIGTVLSVLHPALLPAMAFVAMNVAASRVFLRMHFLTDVLVGALLGILIGSVAAAFFLN